MLRLPTQFGLMQEQLEWKSFPLHVVTKWCSPFSSSPGGFWKLPYLTAFMNNS